MSVHESVDLVNSVPVVGQTQNCIYAINFLLIQLLYSTCHFETLQKYAEKKTYLHLVTQCHSVTDVSLMTSLQVSW